jgi:sugar phosphate isomerase/epimerase
LGINRIKKNAEKATHRLPFDGTIDWATVMKKIAQTDYSGAIAIDAMN